MGEVIHVSTVKKISCSFCGKDKDQVKGLVRGRDGHCICNECCVHFKELLKSIPDEDQPTPPPRAA